MKLMTKELEKKFERYPLYSQDSKGGDAKVIVKYFNPAGAGTWLITEASKEEDGDWTMFGYANLGDDEMAEVGYIQLSELEDLKCPLRIQMGNDILTTYAKVERDMYMPDDITLKEAIKDHGFKVPDWMLKDEEKEQVPQVENEVDEGKRYWWPWSFDSLEFEKHIPYEMRFKSTDCVGKNEIYWVTQEPFNEDDLNEFQNALKEYGGEVEKIYVTVRDRRWSYDFEDDKARNVLATVTKDEIVADAYYQALEADGLGYCLKKGKEESQDLGPEL